MNPLDDVITAIATPIGEGGISVIRVSGKNAITVTDKGFRGRNSLQSVPTHTVHFGYFIDQTGETIDEVVATVFKAPHSYTAQDVVEISCHGGIFVSKKVLESVLSFGARLAEPGEFTKRAFLNGRIDLSRAEAVADIIHSKSDRSHRASLMQLQGKLSEKVENIKASLIKILGLLELELDFVEEGLEFNNKSNVAKQMESTIDEIDKLIGSYKVGKVFRDGVKVVLAGKPNVGKSSIINMLLSENRAIVTEIPGTTRDTIEENILIGGILFRVIDTAGLRETNDLIEVEGIRRTEKEIEDADLVVFIVDASSGFGKEDEQTIGAILRKKNLSTDNCLVAVNKIDLVKDNKLLGFPTILEKIVRAYISAKTGNGFDIFENELVALALPKSDLTEGILITNSRHKDVLLRTKECLCRSLSTLRQGGSSELIALDLRQALNTLGEIVGTITTDEVLNTIFAKFCIGK